MRVPWSQGIGMPRRVTDRQAGLRQRPDGRDPLMSRESRPSNSADTTTTIHQNRSHLQVTLSSTLHGVRWEILLFNIDTGCKYIGERGIAVSAVLKLHFYAGDRSHFQRSIPFFESLRRNWYIPTKVYAWRSYFFLYFYSVFLGPIHRRLRSRSG